MKTKSVIYDIYSSSEDTAEVEKAYQHFLSVIQSAILNIITTCKIRIDVGEYMFFDNGIIRHIDTPEIHIIAQGKNIDHLQRVIEKEIADLPAFNIYDRFSFFEKTFNQSNAKLLNNISTKRTEYKIKKKNEKLLVEISI